LGVRFARTDGGSAFLAGHDGAFTGASTALFTHPIWERLRRFGARWTDPSSSLHDAFEHVFFEFDVDGEPDRIPIPSFFLAFDAHARLRLDALEEGMTLLLGEPLSPAVRQHVSRCINALPEQARLYSGGAMLSRVFSGVRLYLCGVPRSSVAGYLKAVGWPGEIAEVLALIQWLPPFLETVEIALDVGETMLPRVGLECHVFGVSLPEAKAKWTELLDILVAKGLCLPSKRDALLAWMGHSHARSIAGPWPADIHKEPDAAGSDVMRVLTRTINHIKVVHHPGRSLEAKAYFTLLQTWLRYDKAKRRYTLSDLLDSGLGSSVSAL
jgi:hypothetical protein